MLFRYQSFFLFQAEDGIRDLVRSRGLGDVYKRQMTDLSTVLDAQGIAFGYPQRPLFTDWSARIAPGLSLIHI